MRVIAHVSRPFRFALPLLLALALYAPAARADEAATLYNPASVYVIQLTLPPESIEKLESDPEGEYQPGTFSIAETEGTPGSEKAFSTPVKVEVRLKGHTSFESLAGKAAFKLKFKKGERPFGLKKMTLNNMVQDPSMVHETLAYEAFRASGVPASRTGFADVVLNGSDYGMHLDIETVDGQMLERLFGPFDEETQHLYEGEDGADVRPGGAGEFEVDEGDAEDVADLEALITAVNSEPPPASWTQRVSPFADLEEMTEMWAVEKYVGQWDGYSGQEGLSQPNNYYLYDSSAGVFQMLPWGTDETFESEEHIPFDGHAGILFDKCLEDAECAATYWRSLTAASAAIASLGQEAKASEMAALLLPWQEAEQANGGHHVFSVAEIEAGVEETREYIASRPAEAAAWLADHRPPPVPSPSQGAVPSGSSGAAPLVPSAGAPLARLRALGEHGDRLRTRLELGAAAQVGQRASFASPNGERRACVLPAREHQAGSVVLECDLSAAARRRRRHRSLRLEVTTVVEGPDGETRKLVRRLSLPRD